MQSENHTVELLARISNDIHAIRKNIIRLVRDSYRQDLERAASTPERQEMWRLFDGTISTEDIAKRVGVSARTVQYFVQDAEKVGLVKIAKRGFPKRTEDFDVIPSEWKSYKKPTSQPLESTEEVREQ